MKKLLLVALFIFCGSAFSQELMLFDLPLQNANRASLKAAILKAGGRLVSSKGPVDKYDARKIGLPGAQTITVLYSGDQFVLAQYSFPDYFEAEERLRRMLVAKYGKPQGVQGTFSRGTSDFDGEYISDGVYYWKYTGGMEVQYNKPFSDPITLSYVNTSEKTKLDAQMESAEQERAKRQSTKNKSVF